MYRFTNFNNDWKLKSLGDVVDIINVKNKSNQDLPILTNSAKKGIIKQIDYFEITRNSPKNLSAIRGKKISDIVSKREAK